MGKPTERKTEKMIIITVYLPLPRFTEKIKKKKEKEKTKLNLNGIKR